jgi:3D (Asp-Asp-Asp) domain-containing protein
MGVVTGCQPGSDEQPSQPPTHPRPSAAQRPRLAARAPAPSTPPPAAALRRPGPRLNECSRSRAVRERTITRPRWIGGVAVTEYYSTPERWFHGRKVSAPGLRRRHRVDWLYSARGVAMEGDGIGADGRHYHLATPGVGSWMNRAGARTFPGRCAGHWSRGRPYWFEGGWRNRRGGVTFPTRDGRWSNGRGATRLGYAGMSFAAGSAFRVRPYRTLAVDPHLIPRGSRVFIPAYRKVNGGWFVAEDTGGAIIGRHVDVYRSPTHMNHDGGRYLRAEAIYVEPPGPASAGRARAHGN